MGKPSQDTQKPLSHLCHPVWLSGGHRKKVALVLPGVGMECGWLYMGQECGQAWKEEWTESQSVLS